MYTLTNIFLPLLSLLSHLPTLSLCQNGYMGYHLAQRGDPESVIYETADTPAAGNVSATNPPPDVFLNASVSVGEISIEVQNLTAKVNLAAQVLQLLQFNAGVDASINRVSLLIQNVSARVELEARLGNLVLMISDVMDSLDLNPVLATLGSDLGNITNATVGALNGTLGGSGGSGGLSERGVGAEQYNLLHNILYSINDYSGNTHTNRVLSQSGNIVNQLLDNSGRVTGERTVGSYLTDMHFNGHNKTVTKSGREVNEQQYVYNAVPGVSVIAAIYTDAVTGAVVATQVLSEAFGGGDSTVAADEELK